MEDSTPEKKLFIEMFKTKELSDEQKMTQWRDSAFKVAVEKHQDSSENAEMVLQTGEAFGRGLFAERLQQKSPHWTMKTWVEESEKDIFKPLGTEFTFTKISSDVATTFMNRDPLKQISGESTVASLFHYGVMRGLFLSAFPQGEILLDATDEKPGFMLKTHASAEDRFERERVKRMLASSRKG